MALFSHAHIAGYRAGGGVDFVMSGRALCAVSIWGSTWNMVGGETEPRWILDAISDRAWPHLGGTRFDPQSRTRLASNFTAAGVANSPCEITQSRIGTRSSGLPSVPFGRVTTDGLKASCAFRFALGWGEIESFEVAEP